MGRKIVAAIVASVLLWSESDARAQSQPPPAQLERVTLQQAVERAVARYPSAVAAAADIRRAIALVREARASSLPTLTGNAIITRLNDDRVFGARIVAAANQQAANLNLTIPLVVPQRWVMWSHAADNVDVSKASAKDVRRQIGISTARAYLTVVSQHRIVEVSERAVATAKAHFQFAKAQLEGGVGTRIDQVRAEQELATSENQVQLARVAVFRVQEALGVLLGAGGPVDAVEEVALPSPPSAVNAAIDEASSLRTDVLVARQRVRASERVSNDSWTDFMPFLVGTIQPFYQNPPSLVNPTWGWQAQLILTVPLFDGGLRYGQADERRALVESARAQQEGILRQARADVRTAFEAVQRADDALQAARRAAQLAAQALELANLSYSAGATTNLEVIDAERRARDAETAAVVSEDNARQARLDLLAASGRFP